MTSQMPVDNFVFTAYDIKNTILLNTVTGKSKKILPYREKPS